MAESFPVELKPELLKKVEKLQIKASDIEESFVLGSGKGGQKVNKSASCVQLKHLPTGVNVSCQKHRDREANRKTGYRLLIEQIEEKLDWKNSDRARKAEKIKKQKKRRQRRSRPETEGESELS